MKSFNKGFEKCVCALMKDVCITSSEIHMAVFLGGVLCASEYGCIFVCIAVWDCRQNGVTWGGIFGWCVSCYVNIRVI